MARRNYRTYGSAAFAPEVEEIPEIAPQRKAKVNHRPLTRQRVQLREKGVISVDSILGFICICVMAGMLLSSHAQLVTSSDQVVQLKSELKELESENLLLSAQYEKHFDIQRIEETLGNDMMLPTNAQVVYIDLSQPDVVSFYEKDESKTGFFASLKNIFFDWLA
ncbi:MAG: hypothetical protein R3Y63_10375 [Eubacteriales bacterium]